MYPFFSVDPSLLSCILGPSILFFKKSTFLCSLGIRVGTTTKMEGCSGRSVDHLVLFKGSFKDPRYWSLVFFRKTRGESFQKDLDHGMGTIRYRMGCL